MSEDKAKNTGTNRSKHSPKSKHPLIAYGIQILGHVPKIGKSDY
jgi:hypothetical protein